MDGEQAYDVMDTGAAVVADTLSRAAVRVRCKVWAIYLQANIAISEIDVYDGQDATGDLKFSVRAPVNGFAPIQPGAPMHFERGVYINVAAGGPTWTVVYEPYPD